MDDEFICVDGVKIKSNTNSFKNIFLTDMIAFKYAYDFELFSKENKKKTYIELNTIYKLKSKNINEKYLKY
jgi:hypothetical protein